ncbi:nucleotidyl transferase [Candidatus Nomurabacteria bacterium RIFCSPLOWO2_01_FULL_42_17]|uniref:Nucleotidyl transferase n=1 Tax=Candidatus Nomurabacteria bacterium RIFCSPLOWO2_01_FULL_42_17 TaxID=1801780 RepID=A0A1F6XNA4_9BACT|nr:MAG: nucleotidyl transferase [Candidatus Nomurabacteria bacterium RIFCSPLOWO2_01_FULL_42_17]
MINTLVLLSGGLATRLHPISYSIPKALIDINGKSFIEYQLALLKKQGITDIVICIGFLGEKIEKFVGDGKEFGINIRYSHDGKNLLGTAGAVKKALPLLPETFFVMYGDSYLPTNFEKISNFFEISNKQALMTVIKNNNKWDKSNVIFESNKIVKYDKNNIVPEMKFIDYGLGIVNKKCFFNIKENVKIDLASIYKDLVNKRELLGYEVKKRFYEIGSFDGIEEFKNYINNN